MYSVYNESTDKWSEPQQVDGNELLDNRAHLYTDGDKIYLMYEEASGVLPDNATVEDFAASLEIVYARFNEETGSFENIEKLINSLKDESYQPRPSRRVYIPKKNGKMRPVQGV